MCRVNNFFQTLHMARFTQGLSKHVFSVSQLCAEERAGHLRTLKVNFYTQGSFSWAKQKKNNSNILLSANRQ